MRKRITVPEALAHPWFKGHAPAEPLQADILRGLKKYARANLLRRLALQVGAGGREGHAAWCAAMPCYASGWWVCVGALEGLQVGAGGACWGGSAAAWMCC